MTASGEEKEAEPRGSILDSLRALLVAVGYGTLALAGITIAVLWRFPNAAPAAYVVLAAALLLLVLVARARDEQFRFLLGAKLRPLADVLVLGVLVLWGLFYNTASLDGISPGPYRQAIELYRPLAEPEVLGFVGLHALTVVAYAVSRCRPDALRGAAEPLVHAFLIAGILLHASLAVQLRCLVLWGFLPPLLPLATPLFTILLYAEELVTRLRRRGAEAMVVLPLRPRESAFRLAPPQLPLPPAPRIDRRLLARAFAVSLVLLGAWGAGQKAFLGWAPLQVFTRTHAHTLSMLPAPDYDLVR